VGFLQLRHQAGDEYESRWQGVRYADSRRNLADASNFMSKQITNCICGKCAERSEKINRKKFEIEILEQWRKRCRTEYRREYFADRYMAEREEKIAAALRRYHSRKESQANASA
jgi:hypothetical protein